jgi:YVTN family beta-propeller protein
MNQRDHHTVSLRVAMSALALAAVALIALPASAAVDHVADTIAVGAAPAGMALSPDGSRLYVANVSASSISVIDTATQTVTDTIVIGDPTLLTLSPDGSRLFVAQLTSPEVIIIDTATHAVEAAAPVNGDSASMVAVSPDGNTLYVSGYFSADISVVAVNTATLTDTIPAGSEPLGLALTSDGATLYVGDGSGSALRVIDTASSTVTATVALPADPHFVALSPDEHTLYVGSPDANSVYVVDTSTLTVTSTWAAGGQPFGIAVSPDGSTVYVANRTTNSLSVIDADTGTFVANIPVGNSPFWIEMVPDGYTLYLSNFDSDTVSVLEQTPGAPQAPTSFTATPGDSEVDLTWVAPIDTGTLPVTDYVVEYKASSDSTWVAFADGVSTGLSATVTGLTNGTEYDFRVAAVNTLGTGVLSEVQPAIPFTTPDAPTALTSTPGDSEVALSWTPGSDGGRPVTDYIVEFKEASDSTWAVFADGVSAGASATVTGLVNGTEYDFRVSARTVAGDSPSSGPVAAMPATVPAAPTGLAVTSSAQQVALNWTAPGDTGGSAITDYLVEYKASSSGTWLIFADGVSAGASATVTGLVNGTAYDFRVSATNSAGTGIPSAQVSAAPMTVPGAPTGPVATPGDGQVGLAWSAPADNGGSPITDYVIEYRLMGSGPWLVFADGVSAATSATVTGLTDGKAYEFRVTAVNAEGPGATSTVVSASASALATTGTEPRHAILLALLLAAAGVALLVGRRRFTVQ